MTNENEKGLFRHVRKRPRAPESKMLVDDGIAEKIELSV
jgi:hypothetical protein